MEKIIYYQTWAAEDNHWWFRGRRTILAAILSRLALPVDAAILEMGCGSGGNFPLLARFGKVYAVEPDETARAFAQTRGLASVRSGNLPGAIPFEDRRFDLIVMTDVLEHLEEDELALRRLAGRLTPTGLMLVTVPAFPALWSIHDELHHHQRRYTKEGLGRIFSQAGYHILFSSYYNMILAPLIIAWRMVGKMARLRGAVDLKLPPAWLNRFLAAVFGSERHFLRRSPLPFGTSILLLAQKTPSPE